MVNNIFTIERTRPQTFTYSFNGITIKKSNRSAAMHENISAKKRPQQDFKNKTEQNRTRTRTNRNGEKEILKINLKST